MIHCDGRLIAEPGYFNNALRDLDELVERAVSEIRASGVDFDTVVGTGMSGALVIPALAKALGVEGVLVRKDNESSHDRNPYVGRLGKRWLFIDDIIATGFTLERVKSRINEAVDKTNGWVSDPDRHFTTMYVGAYFYSNAYYGKVRVRLPDYEMRSADHAQRALDELQTTNIVSTVFDKLLRKRENADIPTF